MDRLPDHVRTERLSLRLWRAEDAPGLHDAVAASIEELRPWLPWVADEPLTVGERAALIETWRKDWVDGGSVILGVFLDQSPIGGTGLHRRRGPGALEIGYWIHSHHVGAGYSTELAQALTTTALAIDGINRVEIRHDQANVISGKVPARLGYRLDAEVADEMVTPGDTGVTCIWAK